MYLDLTPQQRTFRDELREYFAKLVTPELLEEMRGADEIFFTGTTTEVRPTVRLDDEPVGNGKVGPVATALYEAFKEGTRAAAGTHG